MAACGRRRCWPRSSSSRPPTSGSSPRGASTISGRRSTPASASMERATPERLSAFALDTVEDLNRLRPHRAAQPGRIARPSSRRCGRPFGRAASARRPPGRRARRAEVVGAAALLPLGGDRRRHQPVRAGGRRQPRSAADGMALHCRARVGTPGWPCPRSRGELRRLAHVSGRHRPDAIQRGAVGVRTSFRGEPARATKLLLSSRLGEGQTRPARHCTADSPSAFASCSV